MSEEVSAREREGGEGRARWREGEKEEVAD